MFKEIKRIKEIYKDGPVDINRGLLSDRIYFDAQDVKEIRFGIINQRKLEDDTIFWTRRLFITCEDYTKKGKPQTIEITLLASNPNSLKANKGGMK